MVIYMKRTFKKIDLSGKRFFIFIACAFIFSCMVIFYAENRIYPVLKTFSIAKTTSLATEAINSAIEEKFSATTLTYNDMVQIDKDDNGKITNIKTDVVVINKLKAEISSAVVNKVDAFAENKLQVPIGSVLGGGFLYGKGPNMNFKIIPIGGVEADIVNQFSSAGINQTRHQILVHVKTSVYVVLPSETTEVIVENDFLLAETIIVGDIPQVYVN